MARYDSPSSNSTAVNPMTASGAEQKLTFWIACFRFCAPKRPLPVAAASHTTAAAHRAGAAPL